MTPGPDHEPDPDADPDPDAALDAVLAALRAGGTDTPGDWELRQLAGGWSRRTYLLDPRGDTDLERPGYIVRVKPQGSLLETDLVRECRVYEAAAAAGVPVPQVRGLDPADRTALDGPFFVMDRAPGHSPLVWRRRDREALEANWAGSRSVATDVVAALAAIHEVPADGLGFLGPPMSFAAVVARWRALYDENATVEDPVVIEAFDWVSSRDPGPVAPQLVHADFRTGNILFHDDRISAVIDWELAYLGDPRFDLGYAAMPYYAGKFVAPGSDLLGAFADTEWFLSAYERLRGVAVDREVVRTYTVLGTLSLIAISLVGVALYARRRNDDIRLVWNRFAIPGLRQDMVRLMGW